MSDDDVLVITYFLLERGPHFFFLAWAPTACNLALHFILQILEEMEILYNNNTFIVITTVIYKNNIHSLLQNNGKQ